jgi:hypothetical protein
LHDVARDGRVPLDEDVWRQGITALLPGFAGEQDLSWADFSVIRDISADGKTLLFDEVGEAGGELGAVYLRRADANTPVRLGTGVGSSLSPDEKWVLGFVGQGVNSIQLLPTGTGEPKLLPNPDNLAYQGANWLAGSKQVLFIGDQPGHGPRVSLYDLASGNMRTVTPGRH